MKARTVQIFQCGNIVQVYAGNDTSPKITDGSSTVCRLFRKVVQQGRSERRGESYSVPYVEPLSDARTMLAGFVNSLLDIDTDYDRL